MQENHWNFFFFIYFLTIKGMGKQQTEPSTAPIAMEPHLWAHFLIPSLFLRQFEIQMQQYLEKFFLSTYKHSEAILWILVHLIRLGTCSTQAFFQTLYHTKVTF